MTPSQIITQQAQNTGANPQKVLQSVFAQVNSGHTILLQENNSILLVTRLGDKRASLSMLTIDDPKTIENSLSGFLQKLKKSEINTVYGPKLDTNEEKIMKKTGWEVKKSNLPKFSWMAEI